MPVLADPLGWFTLQFPDGWTTSTEDCVTTLHGPAGSGTVYVGGGRHAGGPQSGFGGPDFLARFLNHIGVRSEVSSLNDAGGVGCRVYSCCRTSGGQYWRYWSVTDGETALLVSYNCPADRVDEEGPAVEEMVRSIRLYGSGRPS
jgi:hypothetical protein